MKLRNVMAKTVELKNLGNVICGEGLDELVFHGMVVGYDTRDNSYLVCSKKYQYEEIVGFNERLEGIISFATHLLFDDKVDLNDFKDENYVFWVGHDNLGDELQNPLSDIVNMDWNLNHDIEY